MIWEGWGDETVARDGKLGEQDSGLGNVVQLLGLYRQDSDGRVCVYGTTVLQGIGSPTFISFLVREVKW